MSRPSLSNLDHGQQSWDATVNVNSDILTQAPLPVVEYADEAALPAANLYDRCIAATLDGTLWISDGTNWSPTGGGGINGSRAEIVSEAQVLTPVLGSGSASWVGAIPAGATLLGVTGRVTTAVVLNAGGTHLEVGDGTDQDRFSGVLALALGSNFDGSNATADPTGWAAAARDVVLTAVGGTFAGTGDLRVVVTYLLPTAPTS